MKTVLSKNEIRGIFMRNGFTIKEGCDDLKDYVYAAAFELLEAQEIRYCEIESRLESIERMLGAESKRFLSESEGPSPGMILIEDEPDWRPMRTAPRDETIIKVKLRYEDAALYGRRNDDNLWVCAEKMIYISTTKEFRRLNQMSENKILYFDDYDLTGWRPL